MNLRRLAWTWSRSGRIPASAQSSSHVCLYLTLVRSQGFTKVPTWGLSLACQFSKSLSVTPAHVWTLYIILEMIRLWKMVAFAGTDTAFLVKKERANCPHCCLAALALASISLEWRCFVWIHVPKCLYA